MSDNPASTALPSLTPAFARTLRGKVWGHCALALLIFATASGLLLHRHRQQALIELTNVWKTALLTATDDQLFALFDRFRATNPRLLATAVWKINEPHPRVYPDEPAMRQAVQAAAATPGEVRLVRTSGSGRSAILAALMFDPAPGAEPTSARRAVVCEASPILMPWLLATLVFAIFDFFAAQAGTTLIIRWFDRRISAPLRDAVDPHGSLVGVGNDTLNLQAPGGELVQTVESYRGVARELARMRTQLRRLEGDMEQKIRDHQEGFHRQLLRAEDKAMVDPLTRLYNRAFMETELERLYTEQKSKKTDLSVVMFDVDHFKFHNDSQGHKAGDDVLRFIGELLRGATRPSDRCIRYGGDEFVMLLPGCSAKSAVEIAERIVRLFRQYASTLKSEKPPSMSAGIASLGTDSTSTGHELLGCADRNLYAVKRQGKNAVAVTT